MSSRTQRKICVLFSRHSPRIDLPRHAHLCSHSRYLVILPLRTLRQQNPQSINPQRRPKRKTYQRQERNHDSQDPRPRLPLQKPPSQQQMHSRKQRKQNPRRENPTHQKRTKPERASERPSPRSEPTPFVLKKQPAKDHHHAHFDQSQNSIRQPKSRHYIYVSPDAPISRRARRRCGRHGWRCRARHQLFPARAAISSPGVERSPAAIAVHVSTPFESCNTTFPTRKCSRPPAPLHHPQSAAPPAVASRSLRLVPSEVSFVRRVIFESERKGFSPALFTSLRVVL
jgi:hypothetical protein